MNNLQDRYKRYKEWKLQPHQVAPLSEEQHECATCGTHYDGNYCPRCGQSAKIGRYSFKNALLLFSLPLYLLFRRSPSIPDLRLSECFVAMVYITDMILIYGIIPSLLCFSVKAEIYYDLLSLLLAIIPIKQLSGYSYFSTIWRLVAAFIPFVILCLLLAFAAIVIIAFSIDLK